MESIAEVKEALQSRATTTTLEELMSKGRQRVRVIRPEHIAAMIEEAVQRAIERSGGDGDAESLASDSRREFARLAGAGSGGDAERLSGELAEATRRCTELEQQLASMRAAVGQVAAGTGDASLASALDKLTSSLNERLESFGRKIGVSSAVDTGPVDIGSLFSKHDDKPLESNLDSLQLKQKSAGGIADNLAKLKKLKGGG
jgi:hypothetical protein